MNSILKNKLYLYLTEFFSGMAVMAVELGASRLLAPYFSSSQIVWTIIIGTIMIAMALGNVWGGRAADKNPDPDRLYRRILIAAVWIAAIPVLGKYVILAVSGVLIVTVSTNFLIIAAFVSCMVIFVFPLFLLGTVTPSLAKYTVGSLDDSGKTVGTLGAFNTIGSIIGTFVPTFVSIPAVGTSITFLIFAGILLVLALIYFIAGAANSAGSSCSSFAYSSDGASAGSSDSSSSCSSVDSFSNSSSNFSRNRTTGRKKRIGCIVSVVIYLLCCVFGHSSSFAFWEDDLVYEGESIYNYLQVKETDTSITLSTNVLFGVQSIYMKDATLTGMYYDYALAAPLMTDLAAATEDGTLDVLILGMGTGTYATQCEYYFPDEFLSSFSSDSDSQTCTLSLEGVEIDESITELAHEYFSLSEDTYVATYDGRAYLQAVDKKYDVIMVDAYQDITIPFQMSSVEFFTLVKEHLAEGGVMVVNLNMRSDEEGNINQYLADTISSVFSQVYTADVSGYTNRELYASDNPEMLDNLEENIQVLASYTSSFYASAVSGESSETADASGTSHSSDLSDSSDTAGSSVSSESDTASAADLHELATMMETVSGKLTAYEAGDYLLTDDKAPVELLGMQVIDAMIEDEIGYYKNIFENEGLSGLLDSLS
ncbi:MAG: fused MFS/spermidine synthase [Lachnospiraceae bacterium]|nr:fused MFS/spermidine synthase [Lachnospiraceae bacterium]